MRNLVAWFNHIGYHKDFKGTYIAMMKIMQGDKEPDNIYDVEYEILCFKVKKGKATKELISKIDDLIDE